MTVWIVIGGVALILLIIGIVMVVCCLRRKRRRKEMEKPRPYFYRNKNPFLRKMEDGENDRDFQDWATEQVIKQ
jgi:hypothetical protein